MKGSALLIIMVLVLFSVVGFVLMQAGAPSRFVRNSDIKSSCPGDIGEEIKFLGDVALPFVNNVDEPRLQERAESIKKNYENAVQFYRINRCDEARFSAEIANNEYELLVSQMSSE